MARRIERIGLAVCIFGFAASTAEAQVANGSANYNNPYGMTQAQVSAQRNRPLLAVQRQRDQHGGQRDALQPRDR